MIWNELLVGHLARVDVKRLPQELQIDPVLPDNGVFPLAAVDGRQKVVFEAIKQIWANV
jgi:hypothetical protein